MPAPTPPPPRPERQPRPDLQDGRHEVTAVLVTHDGERWLPRVLPALHAQTRPWQRLVVADTASADGTRDLLRPWIADDHLTTLPQAAGYGEAVASALALADSLPGTPHPESVGADEPPTGEPVRWVWLLHDDSEPDADALGHLLAAVERDPNLGIVGPKLRGWYQRRVLLEMGVTIGGGGRRETNLERGEQDQGQHDNRRETLAVSSAGMLVRRDVWDALGGFDPHLPMMREDVDLCWRAWLAGHKVAVVPAAIVYHAEAASQERREVHAGGGRIHLLDRAGAMRVLLANSPTRSFVVAVPRLAVGTVLRVLGLLLAKLPRQAADELLALGAVIVHPRAVLAMRAARREGHQVSPDSLRRLFPRIGHQLRQGLDALAVAAGGRRIVQAPIGRHRAAETGPAPDEEENLELGAGGLVLRRIVRNPGWLLVLGLLLLTLLAGRNLMFGGRLLGGALLPAPDGAGGLWSQYAASWHSAGIGGNAAAPPYLAVVGLVGTLLLGSASLAVTVLLLGSVPLAGLTAYVATAGLPTSRVLRVWGAAAYALVPVLTGAIAAGRLGTAVATALLPLLALACVRTVGVAGRPGTARAAWTAALLLALVTAFVPLTWLLVLALAVVAVATLGRADPALWKRLTIVVTWPLVLLLPWSARLATDPSMFLAEPGPPGPGLSDPARDALHLLLLSPGGPGSAPGWVGAGLVLAGLVGLAVGTGRAVVVAAWAAAGVGFAFALILSRVDVAAPVGGPAVAAWPGVALALAAAGVLVAAIVGLHGITGRLAALDFGAVQVAAVAVLALAVGGPVVAGAAWALEGADGPVRRASPVLVPAHVAAEAATSDRPRTLVLYQRGPAGLSYALVRGAGPRLGDTDGSTDAEAYKRLDDLVGDLVSSRGGAQVQRLADFAVRYVLVQAPVDEGLGRALDSVPGLARVSAPGGDGLWRLEAPIARLRMTGPKEPVPVAAGVRGAGVDVPAVPGVTELRLSEPANANWVATLDGRPLAPFVHDGWEQAWVLPATGGTLKVAYDDPVRKMWIFSQASLLLVMIVLALPGGGASRPNDEEEPPLATVPARRHAHGDALDGDVGPTDTSPAYFAGSRP